jgi:hypothetical protein
LRGGTFHLKKAHMTLQVPRLRHNIVDSSDQNPRAAEVL